VSTPNRDSSSGISVSNCHSATGPATRPATRSATGPATRSATRPATGPATGSATGPSIARHVYTTRLYFFLTQDCEYIYLSSHRLSLMDVFATLDSLDTM